MPILISAKMVWDRPRKRKKNFTPEFHSCSTQARKFKKKMAKKLKKLKKKPLCDIFFLPKWDEIGREREKKKFYFRIPLILDRGKKIPKKITKKFKNLFPTLYLAKTGWDRLRNRKKKILLSNSVHTRLRQENSEKNSKKIEKI